MIQESFSSNLSISLLRLLSFSTLSFTPRPNLGQSRVANSTKIPACFSIRKGSVRPDNVYCVSIMRKGPSNPFSGNLKLTAHEVKIGGIGTIEAMY